MYKLKCTFDNSSACTKGWPSQNLLTPNGSQPHQRTGKCNTAVKHKLEQTLIKNNF